MRRAASIILFLSCVFFGAEPGMAQAQSCAVAPVMTPDPILQPFANDSIWNRPVPSNATYVDVSDAIFGDPAQAPAAVGPDIVTVCYTSPELPLVSVEKNLGWNYPDRATSSGELLYERRLAQDACVGTSWHRIGNGLLNIIDAATSLADEGVGSWRCPGDSLLTFLPDAARAHNIDVLNGDGLQGYGRASGLPSLGGALRVGELSAGVPHALAVLFSHRRYSQQVHFVWPAQSADGFADDPLIGYLGPDPNYTLGTLLAIPPDVDIASISWNTPQGAVLAENAQTYGWYVVDSGTGEPGGAFMSLAIEVRAALQDFGLSIDPVTNEETADPTVIDAVGFANDVINIVTLAKAVVQQQATPQSGRRCEKVAAGALRSCIGSMTRISADCYGGTGAACAPANPKVVKNLERIERKVLAKCADSATVAAAGYGPLMTPTALVARLQESCSGEAASVAVRSFGGPHAAALAGADATGRKCLEAAEKQGSRFLKKAFAAQSRCITKTRSGSTCDPTRTDAKISKWEASATQKITASCTALESLVAVDPSTFMSRTAAQSRCMVATAHGDPTPLSLDCGPRAEVPVPPRGQAVQIVLDEATWGTRCGDGSPYAFWIRLAPAGFPVEKIVFHLQGGGACFTEAECLAAPPGRFEASSDNLPDVGWLKTTGSNPFKDWTHVFLPYCTQDVHVGGGTTNVFPGITVHRFGAVNARAAIRYVRDVIWTKMDAIAGSGYRPDLLGVAFGGTSAGGFGAEFNYHFVLDDLRWTDATAVPDGAASVDNGALDGLLVFGAPIILSTTAPDGWGALPNMPPYCFSPACVLHANLQAASVPRLKATSAQQFLNVTNQVDVVQQLTTYFTDITDWTNALRAAYCANQGLPGIRYFMPAVATSIHGILATNQFSTLTSTGVTPMDWLSGPSNAVVDAVEEGTLVTDLGVDPFSCPVN